jgi:hypothetical protein
MEASSRSSAGGIVAGVAITLLVALGSCAQVTGLSDDYRYDLDAATVDGAGGDAAGGDAASDAAAGQCSSIERTRAGTELAAVSGDLLTGQCRTCLANNCCTPIDTCSKNLECQQSMRCVFQCQRENGGGNNKAQCLNNCQNTFARTVGACVQASCGSPVCQLQ